MIKGMSLGVLCLGLTAVSAFAAATAFDHAPNSPYGNTMTWQTGHNGGSGFGPWSLTTVNANGDTGGFFVGPSGGNGGTGNIGSISWGIYANNGDVSLALRTFTAGGPNDSAVLAPNQSFSLAMDNGNVETNSTVGFNLLNSNGVARFTFKFIGGGTNYVYELGNGVPVDTGVPFTRNGMQVSVTVGADNAFSLRIAVREGATTVLTGTLPASDIDRVQLFNNNAGVGGASDLFFNDMSVGTFDAPTVASAVSRKNHAGTDFDVALPLSGTPGIEPRQGGATNDYTMLVTFTGSVSVGGSPQAEVIAGSGSVGSGGVSNGGAVSITGNTVTIPLTNVTSQQNIQVRLNLVNGPTNIIIPMGVLVGDANGDAVVNSGDATITRARSGQNVATTNFFADYNVDGVINSGDATVVRTRSGQSIP